MIKTLKIFLVLITLQSCNYNQEKSKLIGNWSDPYGSTGPVELEFYSDSLIVTELGTTYINSWEVEEQKLYLKPYLGFEKFGLKDIKFDYSLSSSGDSLMMSKKSEKSADGIATFTVFKIENAFDYLERQNRISLKLPTSDDLISEPKESIGLNIYVGFRDKKLIVISDNNKLDGLEDLKIYCYDYLSWKSKEGSNSDLHFNLVIDKNVQEREIDSIKTIIRQTGFEKFFRIYTNEEVNYQKTNWRDELEWYGKRE